MEDRAATDRGIMQTSGSVASGDLEVDEDRAAFRRKAAGVREDFPDREEGGEAGNEESAEGEDNDDEASNIGDETLRANLDDSVQ